VNLTFLNSAFLFAAFAAVLPLVIHLISRRRVETVDFSSIRFLKELERKKIQRVRIRQILLLVVRTLIILALAAAVARPTLSGPLGAGTGHARTSVAIVLDTSASMSRGGQGEDLFGVAATAAAEIVGLLGEGDQGFIVTAGAPPVSVVEGGTFSQSALAAAVDALEAGFSGTDYTRAVQLGTAALAGSRNLNRELYVIGDQQATGWSAGGSLRPGIPGTEPVEGGVRAYVLSLRGPVGNVGLASVGAVRRYGGVAGLYSITADVVNHGRVGGEAQLRLFIDGVQVGQAGVDLEPGSVGSASFAVVVDEGLWHSGWVDLPVDALVADNRRYFVIPPAQRSEVLIVAADDEETTGEAYYLGRALDPTREGDRFRVSTVGASRLPDQEQRRFAVVILADAGRVGADGARWLNQHVDSGGGLLVVLGGRTDVRSWNEGILPGASSVRIREMVDRPGGGRLTPSGHGHRLLDGLVFGERLVDEISIGRSFAADVEGVEEVLELPGVGPLLVIARPSGSEGSGEVAVLLSGIDTSWNNLPRSGFLVPLSHRLTERLSGGGYDPDGVLVGEDLAVSVDQTAPGRIDVAVPGGGDAAPAILDRGRAGVPGETSVPGIYEFSRGGTRVALGAVNVDPAESDLASAGRAEIADRLVGLDQVFIDPGDDIARQILASRHGRELWRAIVYVALALVALEMFLARPRAA
jgi:hypothetical protein